MPRSKKTEEEKKAKAQRAAAKIVSRCPPEIKTLEDVKSVNDAIFEGYLQYQRGKNVSDGMRYVRYLLGLNTNYLKLAVEEG
jgi:hypothetical protein